MYVNAVLFMQYSLLGEVSLKWCICVYWGWVSTSSWAAAIIPLNGVQTIGSLRSRCRRRTSARCDFLHFTVLLHICISKHAVQ